MYVDLFDTPALALVVKSCPFVLVMSHAFSVKVVAPVSVTAMCREMTPSYEVPPVVIVSATIGFVPSWICATMPAASTYQWAQGIDDLDARGAGFR